MRTSRSQLPKWLALFASAGLLVPTSAFAEYRLEPGDTLELAIAGIPELRQRSPINIDGETVLPLAGQVKVSGLTLAEARAAIAGALANKTYQYTTPDGRDAAHMIANASIMVLIAEYRPIYVSGDVTLPGERPFRAGMTVRQAVALAGGQGLVRAGQANPAMQAVDAVSERDALVAEYTMVQAQVWRLQAELGLGALPERSASDLQDRAIKLQAGQMKARVVDREKDRSHYQSAITKANAQLDLLAEKKKNDQQANASDNEDFAKIRELFQRGMTAQVRLSEARRAAFISSDQLLQTVVETANLERQRTELSRQTEKLDNQSRVDAWRELQDANLRLEQVAARLKGAGDKLRLVDLQAQSARGVVRPPQYSIFRAANGVTAQLPADPASVLAPGDVVEVSIISDVLDVATAPNALASGKQQSHAGVR